MVKHLEERAAAGDPPYDLSSLRLIVSSGAMFSAPVKRALFEHLPQAVVVDTIGGSEGSLGSAMATSAAPVQTAKFALAPTSKVFDADDREVVPGSGEIGFLAASGFIPFGYYKDPEKSARTFREIDGVTYSFLGDQATVEADGSITLLGRGSHCINTAGEKVFPEEVEEALKTHPAVEDSAVFGVPDPDFGERVTALVQPVAGRAVDQDDVIAHVKARLAGYKAPRVVLTVRQIPRTTVGKVDYVAARELAG
jgi:fatty-acyl-CoA synthase